MSWNEMKTKEELDQLLQVFGGFHDSCLKEMYMWTGAYVSEELSMAMSSGTNVRMLFQRQYENPSAIELLFEGVVKINITPSPENYDSIILGASLVQQDGVFYWADDSGWTPDTTFPYEVSWISAKCVKWRDVSSWMGEKMRYGVISENS